MHANRSFRISGPGRAIAAAAFAASLVAGPAAAAADTAAPAVSPTAPLTADQLKQLLPAGTDVAGFTVATTQDTMTLTTSPVVLTAGGAPCQKFMDAVTGLTTSYGTVAEVDRYLQETAGNRQVHVRLMSYPTVDAAKTVLADIKEGANGCTTLSDGTTTIELAPMPQLANLPDRVGYVGVVTENGTTVLAGQEAVQAGSVIEEVSVTGPNTTDATALQQMGTLIGVTQGVVAGKVGAVSG